MWVQRQICLKNAYRAVLGLSDLKARKNWEFWRILGEHLRSRAYCSVQTSLHPVRSFPISRQPVSDNNSGSLRLISALSVGCL